MLLIPVVQVAKIFAHRRGFWDWNSTADITSGSNKDTTWHSLKGSVEYRRTKSERNEDKINESAKLCFSTSAASYAIRGMYDAELAAPFKSFMSTWYLMAGESVFMEKCTITS